MCFARFLRGMIPQMLETLAAKKKKHDEEAVKRKRKMQEARVKREKKAAAAAAAAAKKAADKAAAAAAAERAAMERAKAQAAENIRASVCFVYGLYFALPSLSRSGMRGQRSPGEVNGHPENFPLSKHRCIPALEEHEVNLQ